MNVKLTIVSIIFALTSCDHSRDYLLLKTNSNDENSYVSTDGKTIIPFGKYMRCFTDTFRKYAIVEKPNDGLAIIDRNEKVFYHVFVFDNGPDYLSDELFRIIENGKIGYIDSKFTVRIKPQYGCAFPFEKGIAKVSNDCKTVMTGEHSVWTSDSWFYIDKQGNKVKR